MRELTDEQHAAVTLRGRTVLVSAAAGAGKTLVLVERLMAYLTDESCPRNIDDFLLITYTRAAAGEMRARILRALRGRMEADPDSRHLRRQLNRLYTARICTLHAYCVELLREFAAQSVLPPDVRVCEDSEAAGLFGDTLNRVLDELYDQLEGGGLPQFGRFVDAFVDMRGDRAVSELVERTWRKTRTMRGPAGWRAEQLRASDRRVQFWEELVLEDARHQLAKWRAQAQSALEGVDDPALYTAYAPALLSDIDALTALDGALGAGWDKAFEALHALSFAKLKPFKAVDDAAKDQAEGLRAERDGWKKGVGALCERISCTHEDNLADIADTQEVLSGLFFAVNCFDEAYRQEKAARKLADFTDYELAALSLLTDESGRPTETGLTVSARFAEILVDEYQDVNARQDALIDALSAGRDNVFYVGDVRQSIYRFQHADPTIFLRKLDEFALWSEAAAGPCKVYLTSNFRSRPEVLSAVNHTLERLMTRADAEMDYGPPLRSGLGFPPQQEPAVELIALPDTGESDKLAQQARAVAARLRALIDAGFARPGDCVILLRSLKNRAPAYLAALRDAGLDANSDAAEDEQSGAVRAITSLLEVTLNPRNDVQLLAALRSPAFAFTAEELASLRAVSELSLYDCLLADTQLKSQRLLILLRQWRYLAPDLPVWRLVSRIYAQTDLDTKFDAQGQADLMAFLELAQACPHESGLAAFLPWLHRQTLSRTRVHTDSAVRLMTIHRSKGLEFPVVVLADLGRSYNLRDMNAKLLMHETTGCGLKRRTDLCEYPTAAYHAVRQELTREHKAEELRLLYVAMTRAQNKLIMLGSETTPAQSLREASSFMDLLLGVAEPDWLAAPPAALTAAPAPGAERDAIQARDAFVYPYAGAVDLPSKMTVTQLKGRYTDLEVWEGTGTFLSQSPARGRGLSGPERGQAYHLAMQFISYAACQSAGGVRGELSRLAKRRILTPEQTDAVSPEKIALFFQSDLGQRVLKATRLWRECKFSMLEPADVLTGATTAMGEEILLQGVIDCFFVESGKLIVLDFKTDSISPEGAPARAEHYRVQLETYAHAAQRMTGLEVGEKLVYFFAIDQALALE